MDIDIQFNDTRRPGGGRGRGQRSGTRGNRGGNRGGGGGAGGGGGSSAGGGVGGTGGGGGGERREGRDPERTERRFRGAEDQVSCLFKYDEFVFFLQ